VEAICLCVVIQLVQRNSHLSGKLNKRNGESHQRDNKENGNAKLMSNLQERACKRHDHENTCSDSADQGPQDCSVHHRRAPQEAGKICLQPTFDWIVIGDPVQDDGSIHDPVLTGNQERSKAGKRGENKPGRRSPAK
jgi:hypothetical protein